MIFDSLKNSALYYSLNPRLEKAFGFIASTDWVKMESGIHELDGKDIYVNVMDTELKKPADAKLEIHNAYLDIQVLGPRRARHLRLDERAVLKQPLAGSMPRRIFSSSTTSRRPATRSVPVSLRSSCLRTAMRRWWAREAYARSSSRSACRIAETITRKAGVYAPAFVLYTVTASCSLPDCIPDAAAPVISRCRNSGIRRSAPPPCRGYCGRPR